MKAVGLMFFSLFFLFFYFFYHKDIFSPVIRDVAGRRHAGKRLSLANHLATGSGSFVFFFVPL